MVSFDLDRHRHGAMPSLVTLLPPHVPHDGRAASPDGFRKRVLYLDADVLGPDLVGAAADRPGLPDPLLRDRISRLHGVLSRPGETLQAESRLALVADRLRQHLTDRPHPTVVRDAGLADRLRDLLDARPSTRDCHWPTPAGSWTRRRRSWSAPSPAGTACRRTATSPAAGSTWPGTCCWTACRRPRWPPPPAATTSPT